jgi:hypothetical protein
VAERDHREFGSRATLEPDRQNRDGAVFIPRRANKEVTQHSLGVIARLRFLDNCGFSFGKKTGE